MIKRRMPYATSKLYRLLKIIPGALACLTLDGMILASWQAPVAAAVFIIAFDLYWLFKTVFFSVHIAASYRKMRENLKIDWMERLRQFNLAKSGFFRKSDFRTSSELSNVKGQMSNVQWSDLYHLIILPAYREPYEVLRSSFEAIRSSSWPKDRMIAVLGIEERGGKKKIEKRPRKYPQNLARIFSGFGWQLIQRDFPEKSRARVPTPPGPPGRQKNY